MRWMTSATFFACRRNWSSTFGSDSCAVSKPAAERLSGALKVAKRTSAAGRAAEAAVGASAAAAIAANRNRSSEVSPFSKDQQFLPPGAQDTMSMRIESG